MIYQDCDPFTKAYVECALWSSTGPKYGVCPCCGENAVLDHLPEKEFEQVPMCGAEGCGVTHDECLDPLDSNYGDEDLSTKALQSMMADCQAFQNDNAELLSSVGTTERHGHDFWLTRNGHGAGFWDRGYGRTGTLLTEAAKVWGSSDLYVGDDGLLYVS